MRKKLAALISFLILIIIMILIIICFKSETIVKDTEKIQIVATLFPQYDFAKHIVGDKADVKLLLNSGVEAHNYEPTAKDMITILNNTEIFLYNGYNLEPWAEKIVDNLKDYNCNIVNLSNGVELIKVEEFEEKHINSEILQEEEKEHEEHKELYDEHIWMNPNNAIIMIDNILSAVCEVDVENSEYYKQNAEKYKKEIFELDNQLKDIVKNAKRKEIAVGGEFAYSYLIDAYDLNFVSVYTNCGHGEDPSIAKIKSVIDYINKYNMPIVYYEELSEGTVAKMIAEETDAQALVLYSIHNGNPEKDSYVSLMKKNVEALAEGIK